MRSRIGSRPSAGTVIAIIALVLGITGAAYAGQSVLTKKQVTKIAKKEAGKQIKKKAGGLAVKSAANADDAAKLGGKSLREISMFVVWDQNGNVLRSSGDVAVAKLADAGRYKATFPIDVSGCAYNVTTGATPNANDSTNFGQSMAMVAPDATDAKAVQIETARDDGVEQNTPAYMTVQC